MSSQADLKSLLQSLGVDLAAFRWQELAACVGAPTNWFFDDYETNRALAKQIDQMCSVCPIAKQCYQQGSSNKETGVWGGFYLTYGTVDKNRNAHKTPAIVKNLAGRVYD